MEVTQLNYTIQGLTPLLMHNPRGMVVAAGNSNLKKTKSVPSPQDEAEMGTYRTAEGVLGFPAIGIRNAMITAASAFKQKGLKSWKGFVTHVQIVPADLLVLTDHAGDFLTEYEIDIRRCVIKGHGAILRARPMIKEWQASFAFIVDRTMLPTDDPHALIKAFLLEAGSRIGLGDYRPEKTGWFGRFTVLDGFGHGLARKGLVRLGMARLGRAGVLSLFSVAARRCLVWQRSAGRGLARQREARFL